MSSFKDYRPLVKASPKSQLKSNRLRRFMLGLGGAFVAGSLLACCLLRWLPPITTAFMLYRHAQDFWQDQPYTPINYRWVESDHISPAAFKAVIASEDQLFFEHIGFDVNAMANAVPNYLKGRSMRGASTLSQQVAKNLFLIPAKSIIRKGFEVWFTVLCESFLSKERILTIYLNIAELGDHLFGIEAASQHYFGIPAQKLSREQAALLAATLPNPLVLKAAQPSTVVLARQRWILKQMRNLELPVPIHQP